MIRFDENKKSMKLRKETASYLAVSGLMAAVAGFFWQPVYMGAIAAALGFLSMKSPKGAWGIPVFILGVAVIISSLYR